MNERIQELAEQAHFHSDQIWIDQDRFEKFAELIVKECADFMYKNYPNSRYEVNYMRKHMGDPDWNKSIGVEESKGWVCSKCGIDRTKQECPKGYTAALTGECPMIGEAQ